MSHLIDLNNICLLSDSYKVSHWKQYPPGTREVYSYQESRGGDFNGTVFFGLQSILMKHFAGRVLSQVRIDTADEFYTKHLGAGVFNRAGWELLLKRHGGFLPLEIKAVPEGTYVPGHNALMTIRNTDQDFPWLTNWSETILSHTWYTSTIATNSARCRRTILKFLEETGDPAGIDFKLQDFGFRGVTCEEQAGRGGMAHLLSFNGTDTVAGVLHAMMFYDADVCGFSIPASEHSTITSWGGPEFEVEPFRNMLVQYPTGLVACVSDSYDIYHACSELWGKELRSEVLGRDGCLVVRPDSGDPPTVVLRVLDLLWKAFGGTINAKGYKVLDPHVRVIQGDGIDSDMIHNILSTMKAQGWSADNIAFGSGGGLLQKFDRDTCKFAIKCSSVNVDGVQRDVWKRPIGDDSKASKRGKLELLQLDGGAWETVREADTYPPLAVPKLRTVFLNGRMMSLQKWSDLVARVRA